jgi:hypothetical protein
MDCQRCTQTSRLVSYLFVSGSKECGHGILSHNKYVIQFTKKKSPAFLKQPCQLYGADVWPAGVAGVVEGQNRVTCTSLHIGLLEQLV